MPALAAITPLGGPRPGASVLAVTSGPGGTPRALVAVQRFGEGRSMVFTGEASWRWRMLLPATDRSYDTFWKQSLRWLALPAGDPIQLTVAAGRVARRHAAARASSRATPRSSRCRTPPSTCASPRRTAASSRSEPRADSSRERDGPLRGQRSPGTRRRVQAVGGGAAGGDVAGSATASVLVGGADLEMTDPRLNAAFFARLASASGGRVLSEDQVSELPGLLKAAVPGAALAVRRDLWHTGWSFAAILTLLGAEWILRRTWGLR